MLLGLPKRAFQFNDIFIGDIGVTVSIFHDPKKLDRFIHSLNLPPHELAKKLAHDSARSLFGIPVVWLAIMNLELN